MNNVADKKLRKTLISIIITMTLALASVFLVSSFVAKDYQKQQNDMNATLIGYFSEKYDLNENETVKFGTSEINSYNNIPQEGDRGSYDGKKGDSVFVPNENYEGGPPSGKEVKEVLDKKEIEGIEYKNGEPDFSKIAEATVEIDEMSEYRYGPDGNFSKADQALADKWNAEKHDERNDWTAREIKNYRLENNLVWHERQDCKHMDLVDRTIHGYFTHIGGVAVCKARNNSEVIFDE